MRWLIKWGLEDNKWFKDIFDIRDDWIPTFYRDEPMMRTTSRSESENHIFCQVANSQLTLVEFFNHYDSCLEIQRNNHQKNDHISKYTYPDLWTENPLEMQATKLYTRTLFYNVQDEIYSSSEKCIAFNVTEEGDYRRLFIKDFDAFGNGLFKVVFKKEELRVTCTCKRYERYALLCRHIFYVFKMYEVRQFPLNYVQKRWTRDDASHKPNRARVMDDVFDDKSQKVNEIVREIMFSSEYIINLLAPDMEALSLVRGEMKSVMQKADEVRMNSNRPTERRKDRFVAVVGYDHSESSTVCVNDSIRNKGRGSHKRIKSNKEKAISRMGKRTRKCLSCGKSGHDRRTCTQEVVPEQAEGEEQA